MNQQQSISEFLKTNAQRTLLRFSTMGSVDDGKSTLIGRLLYDSKNLYEDHISKLEGTQDPLAIVNQQPDFAILTDGLKAEQEQGITIDVAYRYFSTPKRHFILADTPGHEQYTRNMATGASTANLALLLIDASKGVVTQTKRHAFIASLLGIPHILVAVNKLDLVDYSEAVFNKIKQDFIAFSAKLRIPDQHFVPISALNGDNVFSRSTAMPWYEGDTVMSYLENVYIGSDHNLVDFRFPVQLVLRPDQNYRGYAGQIASGAIREGEEIIVLPSLKRSKIAAIDYDMDKSVAAAQTPMSVTLRLQDELDISRGDLIVRPNNMPRMLENFEAMLIWMNDEGLDTTKRYIIRHTSNEAGAYINQLQYKIDVDSLARSESSTLGLNDIGRVSINTTKALFIDPYARIKAMGSFLIIDPSSCNTVAAGMIIDRYLADQVQSDTDKPKSSNITREAGNINLNMREAKLGVRAKTLWLTGLSASGKSTLAIALEQKLFDINRPVYRLDGDNVRFGLNRDLDFSPGDRKENIRRIAEVAHLFNDAGISVICSFVSPYASDREMAKEIVGADKFLELHICTPLTICERRDPKGLYKKARDGEISNFTGISAPYEAPENPAMRLDTSKLSIEECLNKILDILD